MKYHAGGVRLTSIPGYQTSKEFEIQGFDASSADRYETLRQQKFHEFS
jgi:hypothetical protein